jgi:hypothetical protein
MRQQHLDLFPLFASGLIVLSLCDVSRHVSGVFMNGPQILRASPFGQQCDFRAQTLQWSKCVAGDVLPRAAARR